MAQVAWISLRNQRGFSRDPVKLHLNTGSLRGPARTRPATWETNEFKRPALWLKVKSPVDPGGFQTNQERKQMITLSVFRNLTSIALTACCAIGVATAGAETYILTDLGVLPGESISTSAAVNRQGHVAGTSGESAFRYDSATDPSMENVGAPGDTKGGNTSRGFGINNSGAVVGDSTFGTSEISHAAIFENGSMRDLAPFGDSESFSRANGINAYGQAVGSFSGKFDSEFSRAFITDTLSQEKHPTLTDLGTLGGMYAQAWAINDFGFVTGNSEISGFHTVISSGLTHAFIWSADTQMIDLGTLAGDYSYGTGINEKNHVVGYSTISRSDDRVHAFLHDGETMLDLGSLGGASMASDYSFALGVNAADQMVGYSYVPSDEMGVLFDPPVGAPQQVAFIYSKGVMVDLNTLIGSAAKRYRLYSATAINDKGQIAAIALDQSCDSFHAVLLTPSLDIGSTKPTTTAGRLKR
jgi:probable HAF family extracellular repeat protein